MGVNKKEVESRKIKEQKVNVMKWKEKDVNKVNGRYIKNDT